MIFINIREIDLEIIPFFMQNDSLTPSLTSIPLALTLNIYFDGENIQRAQRKGNYFNWKVSDWKTA